MITVLFHLHHLYYLPQFLPVAQAMERDGNFKVFYSTVIDNSRNDHKWTCKIIGDLGGNFITAESEKERIEKILKPNFDVVVFGKSGGAEKYCNPSALAVLLYHGIGVKKCYYTDYNPRIDVRYIESQYRLDELRRRGIMTELVVTGFPKLDLLGDRTAREQYFEKYRLHNNRPTILYAPTFYPSSIEVFGEILAEQTRDFNLLVKLHHFAWLMKKYHHQRELWQVLSQKYEHVRLVPVEEYNIVPFFSCSDVLLTEASSTAFEYLATGKPVIVADFVKLRWKHRLFRKSFERRRLDATIIDELDFAYHLEKPHELGKVLQAALSDSQNKKALISLKRDLLLGTVDGKAAARVITDLKQRLQARR
ncbi:MAG: CDP-glycerol glycerophosphotransferase family protein [Candidatus Neomarinimicrobiota bacterium]